MNRQHLVNVLRNKTSYLCAAAMLAMTSLMSGNLFAAGETEIDIPASNLNWAELPTKIMANISGPIVVAIGIGLAVWIMWVGFKSVRRAA